MQPLEETGSVSNSTINLSSGKSHSTMENSKLVLVAVIVIACCSIVAVVLSAVALSKNNDTPSINVGSMPSGSSASGAAASPIVISAGGSSGGSGGTSGKRVFTVAIGHDWGAHNYFDEEGYITGFSKELVEAVCEAAGVDCRTVWDKWNNCWDSTAGEHSMGGQGLYGRWYEGCMGWAKSVNRMQSFSFGTPYLTRIPSYFYVKTGSSFNSKDITGQKIAFLDGWVSDEKCVARQKDITGRYMEVKNIIHFQQLKDAVDSVKNGSVAAVVATDASLLSYVTSNELERKGEFYCLLAGSSMMTRKDSDFLSYWNDGFAKIQSSGKFKKLCDDANQKHGAQGDINCI